MRFEEKLKANAHSEWLAHYVDYVGLKDMLHPVDKHHASLWTATTAATAFSVTTSNFVEMSAMRPSASEGAAGSKRGTAALDPKLMAALIGGTVVAMYGKDDMCEAARSARFRVALVAEVVKVEDFFLAMVGELEQSLAMLVKQAAATRALRAKDVAQRRAEQAAEREQAASTRRRAKTGGQHLNGSSHGWRRTKSTAAGGRTKSSWWGASEPSGDGSSATSQPAALGLPADFVPSDLDHADGLTEAGAMAAGGLPEGWVEVVDPGTGKSYYHNSATAETSWERPAAPAPVYASEVVAKDAEYHRSALARMASDGAGVASASTSVTTSKMLTSSMPARLHPNKGSALHGFGDAIQGLRESASSIKHLRKSTSGTRTSMSGGAPLAATDELAPTVIEVLELLSAKRAYEDLFKRASQLETFALLNHTAVVKLILHHNEVLDCHDDMHNLNAARNSSAINPSSQPAGGGGSGGGGEGGEAQQLGSGLLGMSSFLEGDAKKAYKAGQSRRTSTKATATAASDVDKKGVALAADLPLPPPGNYSQPKATGGGDLPHRQDSERGSFGGKNPMSALATNLPCAELIRLLLDATAYGPRDHGCPKQLEAFKDSLAVLYGEVFCGGSADLARAELLIRRSEFRGTPYDRPFRLGFRVGACLLMLAWIVWDVGIDFALLTPTEREALHEECFEREFARRHDGRSVLDVWLTVVFPVYRGMAMLVLFLWCWGGLLYVWGANRINYLFMLGLDPRRTANAPEAIWEASTLTVLLFGSFIVHFKTLLCDFPAFLPLGFWPLVPFLAIGWRSVFPWRERAQAWRAVGMVLASPFIEVTFLMNFVGDFLTSMVKPLIDVAYGFCFYLSGSWLQPLDDDDAVCGGERWFSTFVVPAIILGPYWFRLLQCLRRYVDSGHRHPHLPNAFKYALSMVVTVFGVFQTDLKAANKWTPYQIVWRLAYLTSTIYSWLWDVRKDWSLVDRATGRLRPRRMLAKGAPWPYYCAAAADAVLRIAWAYTLIPDRSQESLGAGLSTVAAPITAALEIFRRSMWAVLRLENEHLHNTEGYRGSNAIPLHYDVTRRPKGLAGAQDGSRRRLVLAEVGAYAAVVVAISVVAIINRDLDGKDGD